jgi:hypothetical protein
VKADKKGIHLLEENLNHSRGHVPDHVNINITKSVVNHDRANTLIEIKT